VCINKFDLNKEVTRQIEGFCKDNGFPVIGRIPFEPSVVQALQKLKTPIEADIVNVTDAIEEIWSGLKQEMARLNHI
jgi:MinD superfamily P-loop ATPase